MNVPAAPAPARLCVLGYPRLDGRTLTLRKGLAILAVLERARRPVGREALAAMLWPDAEETAARSSLRRLLNRVRTATGSIVAAEGDALRLDGLCSDLAEIEAAVAAGEAARCADVLAGGVAPFLEGFGLPESEAFEDWRAQHAAVAHALIGRAFGLALQAPSASTRLSLARAYVAHDPYEPAAHQALVGALVAEGRRLEAQHAAARFEALSREGAEASLRALLGPPEDALPLASLPPPTRYVRSEEAHIGYQIVGEGLETIVFLPGFVSHLDLGWRFAPVADFLHALAEARRVLLLDRRGVGVSDRIGSAPTVARTAADLAAVLDAAGVEHAVVFAASEAAPAAIRFAHDHPERTTALILFGALAKGSRSTDYPWALSAAQHRRWLAAMRRDWGGAVAIEAFAPSLARDPEARAWWAGLLRAAASPGTLAAIVRALAEADVRAEAQQVRAPALVLHRRGDRAVRFEAGRDLAQRLPHARFKALDGADHWPWAGDSAAVLAEVRTFLENPSVSRRIP